jgi:hypothetical protein
VSRMLIFLREWLDKHQVAFARSELLQLFRIVQERVRTHTATMSIQPMGARSDSLVCL